MQRFFSSFPDGRAGVALLLLRLATAVALLLQSRLWMATSTWQTTALGTLASVIALLVLAGFMTPIAGTVAAAISVYGSGATDLYPLVIVVAIILLGPGAFSVDARLFGRRLIVL
ncbi:MAG: hypothetical protein ABI779_27035 [Acidobacteriota bacterium]